MESEIHTAIIVDSFEALATKQTMLLANTQAQNCEETLKQCILEAMDWFNIDRTTMFPNSMLFFSHGKTISVARPPHQILTAKQVSPVDGEKYLRLIGNSSKTQLFSTKEMESSDVTVLRMIAAQGGSHHYTIPLVQFGQRWGGMSFTLFNKQRAALSEKELNEYTYLSHMWLSFWQHSKLHRTLYKTDVSTHNENTKMLRLSQRQYDVLALLTTGKSAKECAKELNLSPRTIESHKYRLLDLLELDSHAELVQFALRNGVEY